MVRSSLHRWHLIALAAIVLLAVPADAANPGVAAVYVARSDVFADALSGSVLAASENAPLLLVTPNALPDATRTELVRLKPHRVVLLGGDSAISAAVADEIASVTGVTPERLSGADRYQTATAISKALPGKVANADRLDGKDSTYFLAADGTAADADALGGRPAGDYALRSGQSTLLGRLGPQPYVLWDYETSSVDNLASLTVDVGDQCGDGSTLHDLRVDVHAGGQPSSAHGSDQSYVTFHIEDNFQIAASFAYAFSASSLLDLQTVGAPTFLADVAPGSHTITLRQGGSGHSGTNARGIYLTLYDFAVTDLGWTCG
jgi:hypothetical protein